MESLSRHVGSWLQRVGSVAVVRGLSRSLARGILVPGRMGHRSKASLTGSVRGPGDSSVTERCLLSHGDGSRGPGMGWNAVPGQAVGRRGGGGGDGEEGRRRRGRGGGEEEEGRECSLPPLLEEMFFQ